MTRETSFKVYLLLFEKIGACAVAFSRWVKTLHQFSIVFSLANPSFLFKTSVAGGLETGLMAIKKTRNE